MSYVPYLTAYETPRLKEMMALVDQGLDNHQVAEVMGIRASTVSGMVTSAMRRYGWKPPQKDETPMFSDRERQVLALYAQGMKPQTIATMLHLTTNSVYGAIDKCKVKLGVMTTDELKAAAREQGYDRLEQAS